MSFVDPPEPPDAQERMKAGDLKNKVCLIRPDALGEWPASEDKKAQPYVECSVWVLDRAGIVEQSDGVRISWWRAVAQLREHIGSYILAMPVEQDDRSVILLKTSKQEWRDIAATAVKEIGGSVPVTGEDEPYSGDPF